MKCKKCDVQKKVQIKKRISSVILEAKVYRKETQERMCKKGKLRRRVYFERFERRQRLSARKGLIRERWRARKVKCKKGDAQER